MDLYTLLITLIVFGLAFYVIQSLLPIAQPFKNAALAVLVVILIVYLLGGHLGHTLVIK